MLADKRLFTKTASSPLPRRLLLERVVHVPFWFFSFYFFPSLSIPVPCPLRVAVAGIWLFQPYPASGVWIPPRDADMLHPGKVENEFVQREVVHAL